MSRFVLLMGNVAPPPVRLPPTTQVRRPERGKRFALAMGQPVLVDIGTPANDMVATPLPA